MSSIVRFIRGSLVAVQYLTDASPNRPREAARHRMFTIVSPLGITSAITMPGDFDGASLRGRS